MWQNKLNLMKNVHTYTYVMKKRVCVWFKYLYVSGICVCGCSLFAPSQYVFEIYYRIVSKTLTNLEMKFYGAKFPI